MKVEHFILQPVLLVEIAGGIGHGGGGNTSRVQQQEGENWKQEEEQLLKGLDFKRVIPLTKSS